MNAASSPAEVRPQPARPKNRLLVWVRRILLGLALIILALVVAGAVYQAAGARADRRSFLPPGQLYDVGGYRLHLYCTGPEDSSSPPVILETLSGGTSSYWAWVQPEVAKVTRVCSYDRAGRGWSEPGPQPQTLQQTVSDLHNLLQQAGVAGPFVLVGHSIGGNYMRRYAADYPNETVGLVLVDAAHPEQLIRYPELKAQNDAFLRTSASFPLFARLGLFRLYFATGGELDFGDLPARQHDEVAAAWSSPEYFASQRAEGLAAPAIYTDAQTLGSLGSLPLGVVSAGENQPDGWAELQNELAALSDNSLHITVPGAAHATLAFNPQHASEVSRVILQVVEAARTGQPLATR